MSDPATRLSGCRRLRPRCSLCDGNSLLHRTYHAAATGRHLDEAGRRVWAIKGLVGYIARAAARLRPDAVLVGFDRPDHSVRKVEYPAYKAHRAEKPPDLVEQIAAAPDLLRASCFALASALQYQSARQVRRRATMDPRLLAQLLRWPRWLAAWIPDAAGTGLQAWALALGAIALVQPILVSGLVLAIPLEAALNRRAPGRRELFAVAVATGGLAAFLVTANPHSGVAEPSPAAWIGIGLVTAALVAACLAPARRAAPGMRGTLLGIATGGLYGLVAVLLKARAPRGLRTGWVRCS